MSFNFTDGTFLESNESSNDWALKMDIFFHKNNLMAVTLPKRLPIQIYINFLYPVLFGRFGFLPYI